MSRYHPGTDSLCPDCEEHPLGLCWSCREDMRDTLADDMARARWEAGDDD